MTKKKFGDLTPEERLALIHKLQAQLRALHPMRHQAAAIPQPANRKP